METLKAKKKNGQMDFLLYVTVLLLCAFGLVMVFSASYYYAQNKASLNYDGLYYLKNQAKYMAMGLGVMIVMSRVDYHYLEKLRNVGLMVTLLLMLATVFWGEDINGAKRWLNLFDVITFQPSELAKFVLILYMASFMTRRAPQMKSFTRGIVPMLIIMVHHLHTAAAAEEHVHDDGGHDDRLCNAVPRRGGYAGTWLASACWRCR